MEEETYAKSWNKKDRVLFKECSKSSVTRAPNQEKESAQQISAEMSRMALEGPQPDRFTYPNDSSFNLMPSYPARFCTSMQYCTTSYDTVPRGSFLPYGFAVNDPSMFSTPPNSATSRISKKRPKRTSFTPKQLGKLEALFKYSMFPDKHTQNKLASQLQLQERTVKVWFRNKRFRVRQHKRQQQQQQQQSKQPPNQTLPPKDRPTSPVTPTNPSSLSPEASSSRSLLPQPAAPSEWPGSSSFTENPTSDSQMQDLDWEQLEPSVPALFSNDCDINQIMELYLVSDDATSSCSFECLYQYLPPTSCQAEGQGSSLSSLDGPAVGVSPGESWSNGPDQGSAPGSSRDSQASWGCQDGSSRAGLAFFDQSTNK